MKKLETVNFSVYERWEMECPKCLLDQEAPFNKGNPNQPMKVECCGCGEEFILTYDRDN